MPKTLTFVFGITDDPENPDGGKTFVLPPLSIRRTQDYRRYVEATLDDIFGMFNAWEHVSIDNVGEMVPLMREAARMATNLPEQIFDLVMNYHPRLQNDREWIGDNGYDDQLLDAFIEIAQVVYPLERLKRLIPGLARRTTGSSLPAQSGDSMTQLLMKKP